MSTCRLLIASVWLALFSVLNGCIALEWEVERNFRYFLYPSDVAVHRVAADLYFGRTGKAATAEELELFINGPDFWTLPLAAAGPRQAGWPASWRGQGLHDPARLIQHLRGIEKRRADVGEASRLGWASLLAHKPDVRHPAGFTDTCWDPVTRLHRNCRRYGDYVRTPGWIVRAYDPAAVPGALCNWSGSGGLFAANKGEAEFAAMSAAQWGRTAPWKANQQDCSEIRIFVPSDPSDPARVQGNVQLARLDAGGQVQQLSLNPSDQLIIGFGDSFTSGEGNPELPATFTKLIWSSDLTLPRRLDDPATRAQWTDRWCHRSVYSWQVRTAMDVALRNQHQSVTLLPYGCSGAEIFEGLLYPFYGVEFDAAEVSGVQGSLAAVGLAYQELCETGTYRLPPAGMSQPGNQNDVALEAAARGSGSAEAWIASLPAPAAAAASLRKDVARCGPGGTKMKRHADLVLLDIGVNDVQFRNWVAGLILEQKNWGLASGFIPKLAASGTICDGGCRKTAFLLARLEYRFKVLRHVLDHLFLPDLGLGAPSALPRVVIPLYPKALNDENGDLCGIGNAGMTVTVFPKTISSGLFGSGNSCEAVTYPNAKGPITAIRVPGDVASVERIRDHELNRRLRNFGNMPGGAGPYAIVTQQVDRFGKRGFCATHDAASRPPPGVCFSLEDLTKTIGCSLNPDSLHVPREGGEGMPPCGTGPLAFRPMQAREFLPYRHRTRLLRTQNDVFMIINQRKKGQTGTSPAGVLDIPGQMTSGAFHPTAEAHAIVAAYVAEEACKALACKP